MSVEHFPEELQAHHHAMEAVMREPRPNEYSGFSYEKTSRAAQAICMAAVATRRTKHVAAHLTVLHSIMDLHHVS